MAQRWLAHGCGAAVRNANARRDWPMYWNHCGARYCRSWATRNRSTRCGTFKDQLTIRTLIYLDSTRLCANLRSRRAGPILAPSKTLAARHRRYKTHQRSLKARSRPSWITNSTGVMLIHLRQPRARPTGVVAEQPATFIGDSQIFLCLRQVAPDRRYSGLPAGMALGGGFSFFSVAGAVDRVLHETALNRLITMHV